ncbi:transglutaminase-like cysteine peptidase [Microvirga puerhi]|uniref:Transglutaminase-like cysteine peptidase n=1 Tax=Microvirga puerhi TaxID=2876078 RepID=A0ABS7VKF2_9HYPH|nr:transglutaminase-like cysteine peptidase [Microvirga puerhi]MBZ6075492.1 transglutaminase-like cysteine peptidase [Microvirga puerhi]
MRQSFFKNFFGQATRTFVSSRIVRTAFIAVSLLAPVTLAQAQTVASLPPAGQSIHEMGSAKPIMGWVKFCEKYPSECAVNTAEPQTIELTPQVWKLITSVNQRVNSTVKAVTDMDHWGVVDIWSFPDDGKGDCEDFQLLKRRILAENGLPRRAMRMTVVIDELGEGHAVLLVRTNQGDYVLDNKTSSVLPWERTGYVYIKRESQAATGWVSLGGITTSPTTTANR